MTDTEPQPRLITFEEARAMVEGLAGEFPDRFTWRCTYTENGEPNCLVGVALARWGVPLDLLEEWGGCRFNGQSIQLDLAHHLTLGKGVLHLLDIVQHQQDEPVDHDPALYDEEEGSYPHLPWSDAVRRALETVGAGR